MRKRTKSKLSRSGRLIALSWPATLAYTALAGRFVVDVMLLGQHGKEDLAAFLGGKTLMLMLMSFGVGFLYAVNSLVAHHAEKKEKHLCGIYTWQGIWFSVFYSGLLIVLWLLFPSMFNVFQHEGAVLEKETEYLGYLVF
ncbi:MAG: MATE family efflux transporter [Verrucomicrobiota bacterium]